MNTNKKQKKCPRCKDIKDRKKDFYKIKGQSIKVSGLCKKCILKNNVVNRKKIKQKAVEYLGGECVRCGYNKCLGALDFHHLDPKEKDIDYHNFKTKFDEKLKKELDKCILLCANCHREEHHCNENDEF